ncbi:MAG: hypothetical protein RLZZ140_465 [Pseudomonadota bacterium]
MAGFSGREQRLGRARKGLKSAAVLAGQHQHPEAARPAGKKLDFGQRKVRPFDVLERQLLAVAVANSELS